MEFSPSNGVGLSVGATNLAAVVVDRVAVTRSPVLTHYSHRPPEIGVPGENPNLDERGLVITDFVDRVGDPVGIVASDGSTHRGEVLLADALRALLYALGRGCPPAGPIGVSHPAHWRAPAVDALRGALAAVPEFGSTPVLASDAETAVAALQRHPGLPTGGVIALCDFGGTGTSITLVDAADGCQPIATTVRHPDLSGNLIDQALLTHVIDGLTAAGSIDLSGTSAIGSLTRLRGQCRAAKERLSASAATPVPVELPGYRGEVRLTRNELDDLLGSPLRDFLGVLQNTLSHNGIRPADVVAVASVGGGARIPIVTTTLSEHFRVPVLTTGQPELTAAIGGGLTAARGIGDEDATALAAAVPPAMPPDEQIPTAAPALAWSDVDDVPELAPPDPDDYPPPTGARPGVQFFEQEVGSDEQGVPPWYRRPVVLFGAGVLAFLTALGAAIALVAGDDSPTAPASTTAPVTTDSPTPTTAVAPPAEVPPPPAQTVTEQAPPPVTVTQGPPPTNPPTTEAPVPTTEAPAPTTETPAPTTTQAPETTSRPRWRPTAPYPTVPGLPWVPARPGAG